MPRFKSYYVANNKEDEPELPPLFNGFFIALLLLRNLGVIFALDNLGVNKGLFAGYCMVSFGEVNRSKSLEDIVVIILFIHTRI